jgi:ABC-type multidrug transport system permease subunit
MATRIANSVLPRQPGSGIGSMWPLAEMSLGYYQSNIVSLVMTFALPLFFLVVYSFAYFVTSPSEQIRVGVTPLASEFVDSQISRLPQKTVKVVSSALHATDMLRGGDVQVAIEAEGLSHKIIVYSTPPSAPVARLVAWAMARQTAVVDASAAPAIEVRLYSDPMAPLNFLPGVLLMSILNLALFTAGSKLLQERSAGTLRLLRMLPLTTCQVLAADLLGKLAIGILQSIAFIGIAIFLTKVTLSATALAMGLLVCVFAIVCLLAFGVALGGALSSYSNGVHLFTAINLVVVFFGDLFFPASAFAATKPLALLIPTTYLADLLRHFILGADTRFPSWLSASYVLAFTGGCIVIGVRRFRFVARP